MKHVEPLESEEPPSCSASIVFIGKNGRCQWVTQERNGLYGGLYVDRVSAMHYALFENGHHPEAIIPAKLDGQPGRVTRASRSGSTGIFISPVKG